MRPGPADKSSLTLGRFTQTVNAVPGLRAFTLTATYLTQTQEVAVSLLSVPTKDNRAAVRARVTERVPWPQGPDARDALRTHVRGVARRYLAAVKARAWPENVNLTSRCFVVGQDVAAGRSARCATCTAWYCTVER